MGRAGRLQGEPRGETAQANKLAVFLRDMTKGRTVRELAKCYGSGKSTWSDYRSGLKIIPLNLLERVVLSQYRDERSRVELIRRARDLHAAACDAEAGRIPTTSGKTPQPEAWDAIREAQRRAQAELAESEAVVRSLLALTARLQHELGQTLPPTHSHATGSTATPAGRIPPAPLDQHDEPWNTSRQPLDGDAEQTQESASSDDMSHQRRRVLLPRDIEEGRREGLVSAVIQLRRRYLPATRGLAAFGDAHSPGDAPQAAVWLPAEVHRCEAHPLQPYRQQSRALSRSGEAVVRGQVVRRRDSMRGAGRLPVLPTRHGGTPVRRATKWARHGFLLAFTVLIILVSAARMEGVRQPFASPHPLRPRALSRDPARRKHPPAPRLNHPLHRSPPARGPLRCPAPPGPHPLRRARPDRIAQHRRLPPRSRTAGRRGSSRRPSSPRRPTAVSMPSPRRTAPSWSGAGEEPHGRRSARRPRNSTPERPGCSPSTRAHVSY